jgi:hypothetical protein
MPRISSDSPDHFMVAQPKCPVCLNLADVYLRKDKQKFEGWCELCGDVTITLEACEKLRRLNKGHILSRYLAMHKPEPELIDIEHVDGILRETPTYTVLEKLDLALRELSTRAPQPGQFAALDCNRQYSLIHAANAEEARFYLQELEKAGYVDRCGSGSSAKMTAKGYQRLLEIEKGGRQSDIAFVAMWFDEKVDKLYADAIEPAIIGAGYKSLRMKELEHVNRIDDEIIAQIRRSRFMVADFTGQRGGVYFESGYMLGQGRNVFWMCEKSELEKVHFDTRQYNFIDYKNLEEARKRLFYRIMAVEGQGPNKTIDPQ